MAGGPSCCGGDGTGIWLRNVTSEASYCFSSSCEDTEEQEGDLFSDQTINLNSGYADDGYQANGRVYEVFNDNKTCLMF